jgi:hypothetical protein
VKLKHAAYACAAAVAVYVTAIAIWYALPLGAVPGCHDDLALDHPDADYEANLNEGVVTVRHASGPKLHTGRYTKELYVAGSGTAVEWYPNGSERDRVSVRVPDGYSEPNITFVLVWSGYEPPLPLYCPQRLTDLLRGTEPTGTSGNTTHQYFHLNTTG